MTVCKGTVKDDVIVLEPGVHLPGGAEVEVRLMEGKPAREEAFARLLAGRIRRVVGMDEIIEEDKEEREAHADTWIRVLPAVQEICGLSLSRRRVRTSIASTASARASERCSARS